MLNLVLFNAELGIEVNMTYSDIKNKFSGENEIFLKLSCSEAKDNDIRNGVC